MFIRLNSRRMGPLRASAGLGGGIAVLLQLFAAGGLACSTMDMGEDHAEHAVAQAGSMVGHAPSSEGATAVVAPEVPTTEGGDCAMMMHCTAPAITLPGASLDVRAEGPRDDQYRASARLASAPHRTTVPPPRS